MLLPIHIAIALTSVIYTAFVYFSPTKSKLRGSYTLAGMTLATGTLLVISNPAHLVQACISGLIFLSVTFFGIALAQNKLASINK